jgi:hypothetical protein
VDICGNFYGKISAINLKEVEVKFNQPMDEDTATDDANYSIVGNKTINIIAASLSDDKKTVTLILSPSTPLDNQKDYKLSFNNVKDESKAHILKVTDSKFMPVDSTLPVPVSVEALGNKTVKVAFSEPVVTGTTVSSFMIDNKPIVGYIEAKGGRSVIIKVYSPLDNGEHNINIKNVKDYAGFLSLNKDMAFTVVEDKVPPTVVAIVSSTFEQITVKFSEPVDPATVLASNIYWKQGTAKKYSDNAVYISADTYRFEFNRNDNKVQYATDLFITGVKDYSGNTIAADTKIQVIPTLDQTRPEVVNAELDANRQIITVKFSKSLDTDTANKSANYVIKDKDGKEVSKLKTAVLQSDNKTVKVTLSTLLAEGKDFTLEISGVSDNTTLKNVMLPYTKELSITDKTGPDPAKVTVNRTANNAIVINYPEVMAVSGDGSIVEPSKYFYSKDATPVSSWKSLPSDAILNVTPDGKSAIITFPSDIDVSTILNFRIQLVKDLAGNYMIGLTKDATLGNAAQPNVSSVTITGTKEISVGFNSKILANTINPSDFKVTSGLSTLSVIGAKLGSDGKTVILTLADASAINENGKTGTASDTNVELQIVSNATTASPEGKTIAAYAKQAITAEEIAATVKSVNGSFDGKTITVVFNEEIGIIANADAAATDFVVTAKNGAVLTPKDDYTVKNNTSKNAVDIELTTPGTGIMKVAIANPRFIKDTAGNVIDAMETIEVDVDNAAPIATIPTVTGADNNSGTALEITFNEDLYVDGTKVNDSTDLKGYFEVKGSASITSAVYTSKKVKLVIAGAANEDTIKVKAGSFADHDGNVYAQETMTYAASGTIWSK